MVSRLRHIAVVQFALVAAVLYALLGLIIGLVWWLAIGPIMTSGMKAMGTAATTGGFMALGAFAVVLFPIFYGIAGFIGGLIYAALYNLVAGWTGGIEFTLDAAPAAVPPGTSVLTT